MLSKSPLIWQRAFHTSSSSQKMPYNKLKSVILKRYRVASPGKIERSQKNQIYQEQLFQPWTTSNSDNGYAPSEMQSGSLGKRNIHLIPQWCSKSVGHSIMRWLIKKSLAFFFLLLLFQNICARPQHKLPLSGNYDFSRVRVTPEEQ